MKNISKFEQNIRLNGGIGLIRTTYSKNYPSRAVAYIGIILLITSVSQFSPTYYFIKKKIGKEKLKMLVKYALK